MSAERPSTYDEDEVALARARVLAILAESLGVEMPPFEGPLVAFRLDGHQAHDDPVFLGGDLHAVHPGAARPAAARRDISLDFATISLIDHEHRPLDVPATQGIWCTRIVGERLPAAPYLSIHDSEGRPRAWLLLPPPRLMVGIAHFWLPKVPAPDDRGPRELPGAPRD